MTTSKNKSDNKAIDLEHDHLEWLIQARLENQQWGLRLLVVLDRYTGVIKKHKEFGIKSQAMTAVCFSLWRAAFLADKTGLRDAVFKDAREFLSKMLTDNAITYAQDKASKEWTFNYYVNAAKDSLLILSKDWPEIGKKLNERKRVTIGTTLPRRRWDRHQRAFEVAVESFEAAVKALPR